MSEYQSDFFGADDLRDLSDKDLIRLDLVFTHADDGGINRCQDFLGKSPAGAVLEDIRETFSDFAVLIEHEEILRDIDPWDQSLGHPLHAARTGEEGEQR